MIKALLNGILGLAKKLIAIVLTPINLLIANLFPNMASAITTFNNFVNQYIGGSLSYFFSLLPPTFKTLLVLWFTFVIAYYGFIYTYKGIIKIYQVIQKIKVW